MVLMDAIIKEVFEVIAAAGYRAHWQYRLTAKK
jgi:hypothetical protein